MTPRSRHVTPPANFALWADGLFIRGYMVIREVDGEDFEVPEFSLVNGELEDGRLRLAFTFSKIPFSRKR